MFIQVLRNHSCVLVSWLVKLLGFKMKMKNETE